MAFVLRNKSSQSFVPFFDSLHTLLGIVLYALRVSSFREGMNLSMVGIKEMVFKENLKDKYSLSLSLFLQRAKEDFGKLIIALSRGYECQFGV